MLKWRLFLEIPFCLAYIEERQCRLRAEQEGPEWWFG